VKQASSRVVRLLIVDQSPVARERFRQVFDEAPDIDVVAEAGTAEKAMRQLDEALPTAVLVDCDLPQPGAFAAVKTMMCTHRVPIIVTKRGIASAAELEMRALEAGAVALAVWPVNGRQAAKGDDERLISMVRTMSEVKVVRRRRPAAAPLPPARPPRAAVARRGGGHIEVIAIGASTGGPPVVQAILGGLSQPLRVPVLLVQHLSPGFQEGLAAWLADTTGIHVRVGEHGMLAAPGAAYVAPDNRHMKLDPSGHLVLSDDPPENGSRPSVSVLFRSVAESCGPRAIGILLTGMGRDGAKELRLLREAGAVTIAQDEESSVVFGMPGEAVRLKGARYVLPPDRIAPLVEHHLARPLDGGALPGE
jgi:two-component system chemotaxis response regulator CheB